MISSSQNDHNIITKHSLNKCLDHLQDLLQKAEQIYRLSFFSYDSTVNSHDQRPQKTILWLLCTLQSYEAAFDLHSKTESEDIASELSALFKCIWKGNFIYKHYCALSWLVIRKVSDVDIWNVIVELIITVSQMTPSTSISVSFNGTFITHSSASQ